MTTSSTEGMKAADFALVRTVSEREMSPNVRKQAETAFEGIWEQYEDIMQSWLTETHTELLADAGGDMDDAVVLEFERRRDDFFNRLGEVKESLAVKFCQQIDDFWTDGDGADGVAVMLVGSVWSHCPEIDVNALLAEAGLVEAGGGQ